MNQNKAKIDAILSNFAPLEQRELCEFVGVHAQKSEEIDHGYKEGDHGLNMIFAGPTGTGKTFTAIHLLHLLGFEFIKITPDELHEGQNRSISDITGLIDAERLSGIEKKYFRLSLCGKKGLGKLNHILFVDEADEGKGHFSAGWKDQLDQFKRWHLPALGITMPAHMTCIFTTNMIEIVNKDPALRARFWLIVFKEMLPEKKIEILSKAILPKIKNKPHLIQMWEQEEFNEILAQYVNFNDQTADLRVLLSNLDNLVFYFDKQHRIADGELYILALRLIATDHRKHS